MGDRWGATLQNPWNTGKPCCEAVSETWGQPVSVRLLTVFVAPWRGRMGLSHGDSSGCGDERELWRQLWSSIAKDEREPTPPGAGDARASCAGHPLISQDSRLRVEVLC
jgi:hypothetical protein